MSIYSIIGFYKFVELDNLQELQVKLKKLCEEHQIIGTIILAKEGINAALAGACNNIQTMVKFLQAMTEFSDLEYKSSLSHIVPFRKLKVIIKKEIVTFKVPNVLPIEKTGIMVEPNEWNDIISDPDVVVIDTRNHFEVSMGTFKNAIDPKTQKFSDFPSFVTQSMNKQKHKKIAMFCTGGIRCEKASSYLLEQGFAEVYQLKGGILNYIDKIEPTKSLWDGKCFVFDDRIIHSSQKNF